MSVLAPLFVFLLLSACTQLARWRSNPQNGGSGEARRPPLLGTLHPRCQECQLREWRGDEGKGGRDGEGEGIKRCGKDRNRRRMRRKKMRQDREQKKKSKQARRKEGEKTSAKQSIHSSTETGKKRVDWFKGQNARTGWERRRKRGVFQKC